MREVLEKYQIALQNALKALGKKSANEAVFDFGKIRLKGRTDDKSSGISRSPHSANREGTTITGELRNCPYLRLMTPEEKGPEETASYTLAPDAKASQAIRALVEDPNVGCVMSCQMAAQLSTYYALLQTLGDETFDTFFTDTFKLILRDRHILGGQLFLHAFPYTNKKDMPGTQSHPLALFVETDIVDRPTRREEAQFTPGDLVTFTNHPMYSDITQLLDYVKAINNDIADSTPYTNRNMSCICYKVEDGVPYFYAFGNGKESMTIEDIAGFMVVDLNTLKKECSPVSMEHDITARRLLKMPGFYQTNYHISPDFLIISIAFKASQDPELNQKFKKMIQAYSDNMKKHESLFEQACPKPPFTQSPDALEREAHNEKDLETKLQMIIKVASLTASQLAPFDEKGTYKWDVFTLGYRYESIANILLEKGDEHLLSARHYAKLALDTYKTADDIARKMNISSVSLDSAQELLQKIDSQLEAIYSISARSIPKHK